MKILDKYLNEDKMKMHNELVLLMKDFLREKKKEVETSFVYYQTAPQQGVDKATAGKFFAKEFDKIIKTLR